MRLYFYYLASISLAVAITSVEKEVKHRWASIVGDLSFQHVQCPWTRKLYTCDSALSAKWRSCCEHGGGCERLCAPNALLPPNTTIMMMGNSHVRELVQSLVCANSASLVQVRRAADLLGCQRACTAKDILSHCPPVTVLRPGHPVRNDTFSQDSGEIAEARFSNGAVIYSSINNALQVTLGEEGARKMPHTSGIRQLVAVFNIDVAHLDAVVLNPGNGVGWAMNEEAGCVQHQCCGKLGSKPGPDETQLCLRLSQRDAEARLINIPLALDDLEAMGFRGTAFTVSDTWDPKRPPWRLMKERKFRVEELHLGKVVEGGACAAPNCADNVQAHMCSWPGKGPALDAGRMLLKTVKERARA